MMGFTGVYFPFTGEANVNVDAPACLVPATIAHEMSHQRMVFSELEPILWGIAAAVSCGRSGVPVLRMADGLIQLCNALYAVSPDLWYQIAAAPYTGAVHRLGGQQRLLACSGVPRGGGRCPDL